MAGTPIRPVGGLKTADSPSFIQPQDLTEAKGVRHKPDSFSLDRALGRTAFNASAPSSGSTSHVSLNFNQAEDQVYMQQGTGIYIEDVSAGTPSFVALKDQKEFIADGDSNLTSVTAPTDKLTSARLGDAHVVVNGSDRPVLVENNLRGRKVGLTTPRGTLVLAAGEASPSELRGTTPTVATSGVGDTSVADILNSNDGDSSTFAELYALNNASPNSPPIYTYTLDDFTGATSDYDVVVDLSMQRDEGGPGSKISIQVDDGGGGGYVEIWSDRRTFARKTVRQNLGASTVPADVGVKVILETGSGLDSDMRVQLFDVKIDNQSTSSSFVTTGVGIRYLYTEVRKYERTLPGGDVIAAEVESGYSPLSPPPDQDPHTFTVAQKGVKITVPTKANDDTTHFRIYRSQDGLSEPETRALDQFSEIGELDSASTVFLDAIDDAGHPLDYIDPSASPPFALVGDLVFQSNLPPPSNSDVVGSFGGSVTYSSVDQEGVFYWSRPYQPDYVPEVYADTVDANVTAFIDIGTFVVFTTHSVHSYSYLPLISDADFQPGRARRDVSKSHGCVSRLGATSYQTVNGEVLAAFVSGDGIYITNGAYLDKFSKALDWAATVDISVLNTSELIDSPDEGRLIFVYDDNSGDRQALSFFYNFGPQPSILGPQRWPDGSTSSITNADGTYKVFSEAAGLVWLENSGTEDIADLENVDGRIAYSVKTGQVYPGGVNGKTYIEYLHVHTAADATATLTVVVKTRIDGKDAETHTQVFALTKPGWKSMRINREVESFNIDFSTSSQTMPSLDAWSLSVKGSDDVFATRTKN